MKNIVLILLITVFFMIPQNLGAQQNADPAKRILQEFNQLETQLGVHMNSVVLGASNIDAMNRAIDEFMREHSAVKRILRTNNGGFTVNDISADSPPAPPRSLANQRWLQALTLSKTPYYSFDVDSQGAISLFYAWPLLSGQDRSHFSGAFAAKIDLTTHIALIEDIDPFQIAYNGNAFFQHEWDEVDYNEEPLEIKGTENLTIRTVKPILTRQALRQAVLQDSAVVSLSADSASKAAEPQPLSSDDAVDFSDNDNVKKSKSSNVLLKSMFQIFIILLVLAVAAAIAVIIYKVKTRTTYYYIPKERFFMKDSTSEDSGDEKSTVQTSVTTIQPFLNIPSLKKESASDNRSTGLSSNAGYESSSKESVSENFKELSHKEPLPVKVKNPPAADDVDDDCLPPQPIVAELVKARENIDNSSKNTKALKAEERREAERDAALTRFLKSEFTKMENKIKALSDRIEKLEKR